MLNIISIIFGVIAVPFLLIGLVPLFGWTNWFWLAIPAIGAVLGAMSSKKAGLKLNLVVGAIMVVRLMIGGGIF